MLEQASSMRSMALSGRNLPPIYLEDNFIDATTALSLILIPWCSSYFSFKPLRIEIASSIDGSSTKTDWYLLANAASFSMCVLYSSRVVAPIMCNSPLAKAGLSMFEASIAPSTFPAPTKVCNSSKNKIISPLLNLISSKTDLSLSSNSPLYLEPAKREAKSSANNLLFFKLSGTSPLVIL